MLSDAFLALSEILTPPFRAVLGKSLALTFAMLVALGAVVQGVIAHFAAWPDHPWLHAVIIVLTGVGLFLGLGFLIAPVTSLFAGLFADEIAGIVERRHFPQDPPGSDLSFSAGLSGAVSFTVTVIAVNVLCLLLLLVPGVNLIAFFVGNGYLLGREFFEAAAARFRPIEEARALRRRHGVAVFLAGVVISIFLAIPIVNLLTPLFATAFMTHFHKRLTGSQPVAIAP